MNTVQQTTTTMQARDASLANFRQYLEGQNLFMQHRPLDACQNAAQRRGWNDANKYSAEEWAPRPWELP